MTKTETLYQQWQMRTVERAAIDTVLAMTRTAPRELQDKILDAGDALYRDADMLVAGALPSEL